MWKLSSAQREYCQCSSLSLFRRHAPTPVSHQQSLGARPRGFGTPPAAALAAGMSRGVCVVVEASGARRRRRGARKSLVVAELRKYQGGFSHVDSSRCSSELAVARYGACSHGIHKEVRLSRMRRKHRIRNEHLRHQWVPQHTLYTKSILDGANVATSP